MKVPTYRCFGGPLNGFDVTEQYAGKDYIRYNSSCGSIPLSPLYKIIKIDGLNCRRLIKGRKRNPKSILVYFE
jgi:hypothetical protein